MFGSMASTCIHGKPLIGRAAAKTPAGCRKEQASVTKEVTLIRQTQHENEEVAWRSVATQLAEEAARVGKQKQRITHPVRDLSRRGSAEPSTDVGWLWYQLLLADLAWIVSWAWLPWPSWTSPMLNFWQHVVFLFFSQTVKILSITFFNGVSTQKAFQLHF